MSKFVDFIKALVSDDTQSDVDTAELDTLNKMSASGVSKLENELNNTGNKSGNKAGSSKPVIKDAPKSSANFSTRQRPEVDRDEDDRDREI